MIKIDCIRVRIRGGRVVSNHHQGVDLARAIGESLAGKTVDRSAKIERIRLLHTTPTAIHNDSLSGEISSRIMTKIRKR